MGSVCLACYNPPRQYKHCIFVPANILRHRKGPKYLELKSNMTWPPTLHGQVIFNN